MIQQLKRIAVPAVFAEEDADDDEARRAKVDMARDRLTWPDVPTRVLWRAMVATTNEPPPEDEPELDPALPLARALLARSDRLVGTDAEIVAEIRGASDEELEHWLGANFLSLWTLPDCDIRVEPPEPPDTEDDRVLEVSTVGTRRERIEQIWPCIQPLNWPRCNDLFDQVDVVPGSYTATPTLADFAGILPAEVDLDTATTLFGCRYLEVVQLPGTAAGLPVWESVTATTELDCIEWNRRDESQRVVEVGMAYRHAPSDAANPIVDVDEGFAVVRADQHGEAQTVTLTSLKRISFKDRSAIAQLAASRDLQELFCLEWSFNFDLTTEECTDRAVISPRTVQDLSRSPARPGGARPDGASGAAATPGGHWLPNWIGDAATYWQHAAGVGFRELQRLEERRSMSSPTTPEEVFYDALEVWEANRRSLNDGLDLTVRFWAGIVGGLR